MAATDAQLKMQQEMFEMMQGIKSTVDSQQTRFNEFQAAQERTTADLTAKLDEFAKSFKDELLKDVNEKMTGVASSVDELQKRMAELELKMKQHQADRPHQLTQQTSNLRSTTKTNLAGPTASHLPQHRSALQLAHQRCPPHLV